MGKSRRAKREGHSAERTDSNYDERRRLEGIWNRGGEGEASASVVGREAYGSLCMGDVILTVNRKAKSQID